MTEAKDRRGDAAAAPLLETAGVSKTYPGVLALDRVDFNLRAGEVLYREGEPTNEHWFVVYGEMKLEAKGVPPWVLGERSLIGTIDLTLDRARSRTACAGPRRSSARAWRWNGRRSYVPSTSMISRGASGIGVPTERSRASAFDTEA